MTTDDQVKAILEVLPGGEIYEVFACFRRPGKSNDHLIRSNLEAAQHSAHVWGPEAQPGRQIRVYWDNGGEYRSSWEYFNLDHDARSCSFCVAVDRVGL